MRLLKRREKYVPPNPHAPAFNSEGGGELWKLILEMHYKLGALETKTNIIAILVLGMLAAVLGAF